MPHFVHRDQIHKCSIDEPVFSTPLAFEITMRVDALHNKSWLYKQNNTCECVLQFANLRLERCGLLHYSSKIAFFFTLIFLTGPGNKSCVVSGSVGVIFRFAGHRLYQVGDSVKTLSMYLDELYTFIQKTVEKNLLPADRKILGSSKKKNRLEQVYFYFLHKSYNIIGLML